MPVKSWTRNRPSTETTAKGKASGLRLKAAWKQFRQQKPLIQAGASSAATKQGNRVSTNPHPLSSFGQHGKL